ncbi:hypothetical protein BS78_10G197600 [Paspalum vaginatum]|nr:hypothetical protein BS78_10G197600 [Paspalum vaginatum]KAJ1259989.1 hypothetical protein BS78_10G197600 [Paspalum vaginatum]
MRLKERASPNASTGEASLPPFSQCPKRGAAAVSAYTGCSRIWLSQTRIHHSQSKSDGGGRPPATMHVRAQAADLQQGAACSLPCTHPPSTVSVLLDSPLPPPSPTAASALLGEEEQQHPGQPEQKQRASSLVSLNRSKSFIADGDHPKIPNSPFPAVWRRAR